MLRQIYEIFSSEEKLQQVTQSIQQQLSEYIDKTASVSNQARYNQGKLTFDVVTLFVGVGEVKSLLKGEKTIAQLFGKIGKLPKNAITEIRKIKKPKRGDAKRIFEKVQGISHVLKKYRVSIFDKVKVIGKDKSLPRSVVESFMDNYYYTAETLENIKVFRRFGGQGKNQAKLFGNYTSTEALLSREELVILTKWNTMQFEAEIVIEKGAKLNLGKVAPYGKYSGGADQVLLPRKYPEKWIKSIKDLKTKKTYSLEEFKTLFPNLIRAN